MKVAVIIPAFNAGASIKRALNSVMKQTVQDFECIVVDDGSTDATPDIVRAVSSKDPRFRLLTLAHNSGVSVARNAGMEHAKAEWIAVLDADDAFTADRLETLITLGEALDADIVADDILYFDWAHDEVVTSGIGREGSGHDRITSRDFLANAIPGRSAFDFSLLKPVARRELFIKGCFRYIDGLRQGEDYMILAKSLLAGATMVLSHRAMYIYTENIGRKSRVKSDLSRTIADCEEMRRQTLSLLEDSVVRADSRLADVINQRARAIVWYESWERIYHPLRSRRPLAVVYVATRDWRAALQLVIFCVRRLDGKLRGNGNRAS